MGFMSELEAKEIEVVSEKIDVERKQKKPKKPQGEHENSIRFWTRFTMICYRFALPGLFLGLAAGLSRDCPAKRTRECRPAQFARVSAPALRGFRIRRFDGFWAYWHRLLKTPSLRRSELFGRIRECFVAHPSL